MISGNQWTRQKFQILKFVPTFERIGKGTGVTDLGTWEGNKLKIRRFIDWKTVVVLKKKKNKDIHE
jgi:hypothetical protein